MKKNKVSTGYLLCLIIIVSIYLIISFLIIGIQYKKYVYTNWSKYKCNPLIMPFASFINPSVSTVTNFNSCISEMQTFYMDIILSPLYSILSVLQGIMSNMLQIINSIRGQISLIRDRIKIYIQSFIQKFENIELNLRVFIIKLKTIVEKMEGILAVAQYTFIILSYALEWIFKIPGLIALSIIIMLVALAILICFFFPYICAVLALLAASVGIAYCFDKNTYILMENNSYKKIKDIKIGDFIADGGEVTGIIKGFHNNDMYNYKNIKVTGEHLVFDNGLWKKVKDCSCSYKISIKSKYVYCLLTENNIIKTKYNIYFTDFNEINDTNLNSKINNDIINYRNKNQPQNITKLKNKYKKRIVKNKNRELESMECGFLGKTKIKLMNGKEKYIKNIKIGDILENNIVVNACIKIKKEDVKLFKYKNIVVSASTPVYENNKWIRIYESKYKKSFEFKDKDKDKNKNKNKYIYHLGTNKSEIKINNILFGDYLEYANEYLDNKIDTEIINFLNI